MKPGNVRPVVHIFGLLAVAASLVLAGCEDPIDPVPWINYPDTVDLYSLSRAEHVNLPGAYDFAFRNGRPVVVESDAPFAFDVAFAEDEAGNFVLLPTGYFPDAGPRAGILIDDTASFDGLRRAPSDGYTLEEPVEARTDVIYVVRSRQDNRGCRYYGKMEILSLSAEGVMRMRTLINPNCGDRSLVPNTEVEEEDGEAGG